MINNKVLIGHTIAKVLNGQAFFDLFYQIFSSTADTGADRFPHLQEKER
jgi:hypothetical protein